VAAPALSSEGGARSISRLPSSTKTTSSIVCTVLIVLEPALERFLLAPGTEGDEPRPPVAFDARELVEGDAQKAFRPLRREAFSGGRP
jgi:hypothetical protein